MIESKNGEYVTISVYNPLSESSYIELPDKLTNSKKSLKEKSMTVNVFFDFTLDI